MQDLHNKPKVFLSHSKKDIEFIKKLESDLRKCQIDPWLDEIEIRHGKPWMNEIFENGIPTCDAILVYFTENSLPSKVVKKEIDAGLLQNLDDNNVAFLPYTIDSKLRNQLRSDIQILQTLEWNENNYSEILPRVVAEIWRSFLEKTVDTAIKEEKLKRKEAELELEKNRNQREEFFTLAENSEFEYLSTIFQEEVAFVIGVAKTKHEDREDKLLLVKTNVQYCFQLLDKENLYSFSNSTLHYSIKKGFKRYCLTKIPIPFFELTYLMIFQTSQNNY